MSSLLETQREFARLIMQPMTVREGMRSSTRAPAEKFIKPNDRLTSFERLEIYTKSYWFRLLDCFAEDFPGVRAIVGAKRFRRMSEAYLTDCPSRSFTLRNLGSRFSDWLKANPKWLGKHESQLILDMVALEWAHIEVFDEAELPPVTPEELAQGGPEMQLQLQPYMRLLQLHYAVDNLAIAVRDKKRPAKMIAGMLESPRPRAPKVLLALHRHEFSVHYRRLEPEAFQMLHLLSQGASLEEAISSAFENSEMPEEQQAQNIELWFRTWQSLGWFCARLNSATEGQERA
ncbi:MAG TPA: DNA-binding domain-containing protein [Terriglobales bacterium]|nr:DNA-binding domain-containing protein [Terriglobales bacterium]